MSNTLSRYLAADIVKHFPPIEEVLIDLKPCQSQLQVVFQSLQNDVEFLEKLASDFLRPKNLYNFVCQIANLQIDYDSIFVSYGKQQLITILRNILFSHYDPTIEARFLNALLKYYQNADKVELSRKSYVAEANDKFRFCFVNGNKIDIFLSIFIASTYAELNNVKDLKLLLQNKPLRVSRLQPQQQDLSMHSLSQRPQSQNIQMNKTYQEDFMLQNQQQSLLLASQEQNQHLVGKLNSLQLEQTQLISAAGEKIVLYKQRITDLENELKHKNLQIESLQNQLQEDNSLSGSQLRKLAEQQQSFSSEAKEQIIKLQEQLFKIQNVKEQLKMENENYENVISNQVSQLRSLQIENADLKQKSLLLDTKSEINSSLQLEYETMLKEKTELSQKLMNSEQNVQQLNLSKQQLENQNQKLLQQISDVNRTHSVLNDETMVKQSEHAQIQKQLVRLQSELTDAQAEVQDLLEQLNAQKSKSRKAEQERVEFADSVESLTQQNEKQKAQISHMNEQLRMLQQNCDEKDKNMLSDKQKMIELESQLIMSQGQHKIMQSEVKMLREERDGFDEKLAGVVQQKNAEIHKLQSNALLVQELQISIEQQKAQYEEKIGCQQKQLLEHAEIQKQVQILKEQNESVQLELIESQEVIELKSQGLTAVKQQLEQLSFLNSELQQQIQTQELQPTLDQSSNKYEEAQSRLEEQAQQLQQKVETIDNLSTQLETFEQIVQQLETQNQEKDFIIQQLQAIQDVPQERMEEILTQSQTIAQQKAEDLMSSAVQRAKVQFSDTAEPNFVARTVLQEQVNIQQQLIEELQIQLQQQTQVLVQNNLTGETKKFDEAEVQKQSPLPKRTGILKNQKSDDDVVQLKESQKQQQQQLMEKQEKIDEQRQQISKLEQELSLTQKQSSVSGQISQLKQYRQDIQLRDIQIDDLKNQVKLALQQVEQKEQQVVELNQILDDQQVQILDFQQSLEELTNMQNSMNKQQFGQGISQDDNALQKRIDELELLEGHYKTKIAELQFAVDSLKKGTLTSTSPSIVGMQLQVENVLNALNKTKNELEEQSGVNEKLKSEIINLKGKLNERDEVVQDHERLKDVTEQEKLIKKLIDENQGLKLLVQQSSNARLADEFRSKYEQLKIDYENVVQEIEFIKDFKLNDLKTENTRLKTENTNNEKKQNIIDLDEIDKFDSSRRVKFADDNEVQQQKQTGEVGTFREQFMNMRTELSQIVVEQSKKTQNQKKPMSQLDMLDLEPDEFLKIQLDEASNWRERYEDLYGKIQNMVQNQ